MSVESSLANKRCHHKVAARAAELAELVLAKKQRPHKTTVQGKALAHDTCKQHCRESAECTAVSAKLALAAERTAVSADLAFPKLALAKDKRRQEETAKKQRCSDDEQVMALVLPPNPVNAAIRRIRVECALLAAPLDAIVGNLPEGNICKNVPLPRVP
jgi:hypothetical protein